MEAGQKVTKALDIVRWRYWFFLFSALVILPGLVSLLWPVGPGLRLSVDFTGGTLWEQQFPGPAQPSVVKQIFAAHGHDAVVQTTGTNSVLIRTKEIPADSPAKAAIVQELTEKLGQGQSLPQPDRYESVGPTVGTEISQRATLAVGLASLGILGYLWYAFRRVPNSFRYGACAVAALLHDAVLVIGIFSILGRIAGIEVDSLFVTALLTIIGFSVHDTIVVFDRIRENMIRHAGESFESIVNHSLTQTLGRSLATSLTVIFTLMALFLFGGVTTRIFALTLLIGIVVGTYSSIFNASQLLVVWENGELGRLFRRQRPANAAA